MALLRPPMVDSAEPQPAEPTTDSPVRSELNLRRTIEKIEREQGAIARDLIAPLTELSRLHAESDRCSDAIPALDYALNVSRQLDGLFNTQQLEYFEPLLNCYLVLDLTLDLERLLRHAVLISEYRYGKNDPRMLSPLQNAARWSEQAGQYAIARDYYGRAIKIARKAGGKEDLRQIEPLRGLARACRLEHQFQTNNDALNALGERSLERAVAILRTHPNPASDSNVSAKPATATFGETTAAAGTVGVAAASNIDNTQLVETLLDLGDWYQMTDYRRDALKIYNEVSQLDPTRFPEPLPILYRARGGIALRRPPPDPEKYQRYSVDLTYTVTREGRATDILITETNAPKDAQYRVVDSLQRTHYRPRFDNGEAVDTNGMQLRQGVYVAK